MFNNPIYESAFKELDLLFEQDFNLTEADVKDDIEAFEAEEKADDIINVIDPDAETEEELDDSNIGKIILQCPCCETIICKKPEDIELPEECDDNTDCMALVGEQCPVCFSEEGYKIIGKVAPFEEISVEVEPKDDVDDSADMDAADDTEMETDFDDEAEKKDESLEGTADTSICEDCTNNDCNEACVTESEIVDEALTESTEADSVEALTEGINDLQIDTDKETISVHAEDKSADGSEMIAPLDFEAANEIVDAQPENMEDNEYLDDVAIDDSTDEPIEAEDELADAGTDDVSVDDFDEQSFDGVQESYFKSVYDNVSSYLTESVKEQDGKLIVEGIITFDSGNQRKTTFVLEGNTLSNDGTCSMLVENLQITPGVKGYTLNGKLNAGSFITESLDYNYDQNGANIKGSIALNN